MGAVLLGTMAAGAMYVAVTSFLGGTPTREGLGYSMLYGGQAAAIGFGVGVAIGPRLFPTRTVPAAGENAPKSGKTVVIGEKMSRVRAVAERYGYETMPDIPPGNRLAANRIWINARMDEGYTIIDIGPAPGNKFYPSITSKYYIMEQYEIMARDYPRYLPIWGVFD